MTKHPYMPKTIAIFFLFGINIVRMMFRFGFGLTFEMVIKFSWLPIICCTNRRKRKREGSLPPFPLSLLFFSLSAHNPQKFSHFLFLKEEEGFYFLFFVYVFLVLVYRDLTSPCESFVCFFFHFHNNFYDHKEKQIGGKIDVWAKRWIF